MIQENKELLLKDLCARVPYVTFVYVEWHETEKLEICEGCEDEEEPNIHTLISCDYYGECALDDNLYKTIYNIKPYLRPMSSMTKEEKKEMSDGSALAFEPALNDVSGYCPETMAYNTFNVDFCLAHHLDFRGLIEKGLALEAPEGMYKEK